MSTLKWKNKCSQTQQIIPFKNKPLLIMPLCSRKQRGGWERQRCHISCVTRASIWYWLTVGQTCYSCSRCGRGGMFLFLLFLHFHSFSSFFPVPLIHLLYYLFWLSSPSLWEDSKWPTRVDVSLNPNTINQLSSLYKMAENLLIVWRLLNLFMPSGLFYLKPLVRSISNIRGVWLVFIIILFCRNFWTY